MWRRLSSEAAADGKAAADRSSNRARFGMGAGMVVVSLFTVIVTALAIHLPWQYTARQNVEDIARQLNDEIITGIRREVGGLFERTEAVQRSIRDIFSRRVVDIADKVRRDQLYFAILQTNPHFSWVSFGYPNGDFFGANRRDSDNFRIVESRWDDQNKQATRQIDYYVRNEKSIYFTHSKTKQNDYYAPGRDWYKKAIETNEDIWTDVYVFASSGKPGINTATVLELDGEPVGVISIAIELERISLYLRELRVGATGVEFIVNANGEMIAFEDQKHVTEASAGGPRPRLKGLSDAAHPLLRIASQALDAAGGSLVDFGASRQIRHIHPDTEESYFVTFAPVGHRDWIVGTVIPEADFLRRIDENTEKLLYALLSAIAVVALVATGLSRILFVRPLSRIIAQTERIERLDLESVNRIPSRIKEIDSLSSALQRMSLGLGSFRKYVPTELVRLLTSEGIRAEVGGEQRTLTILFMDLQAFTGMTEELGHRLLPYLADFLSDMSEEIVANQGTIDKYIGDAIMAFWGAPITNENHATDACRAALQCLRRLEIRRIDWAKEGRPDFRVRIGVNTGRVIVGNIGSNEKLDYTVLGDPVNLASRLEGLNREFGTQIIIGQHTYDLARYDIVARRLDTVAVKGRDEAVNIYEVLAMRDEVGPHSNFAWIRTYERGLELMRERCWLEAIDRFTETIETRGGVDKPSSVMIARCKQALATTVPDRSDHAPAAPRAADGAAVQPSGHGDGVELVFPGGRSRRQWAGASPAGGAAPGPGAEA
jgi:adenylate cyclase